MVTSILSRFLPNSTPLKLPLGQTFQHRVWPVFSIRTKFGQTSQISILIVATLLISTKCCQSLHCHFSQTHSYTVHSSVWTEPNLQVLGLVLCEGGLDPHLQVRGPGLNGPDLRVEPGPDLFGPARTSW